MKKTLSALFLSFSLLFTPSCSDDTDPNLTTNVVIFTRSECTRTHHAIDFLNDLKKKNNITYLVKDLSTAENRIQIKELAKKHNMPTGHVSTPIIFTDKGYTTGWDTGSPDKLKYLLNIR